MASTEPRVAADDVLSVLKDIRQLLRTLVEQRPPPATALSRADREVLERLLPALAVLHPDAELFTSGEIVTHPAPGLKIVRRRLTAKQLGRLFMRAEGLPVGGYKIQKVGTELGVCLWRVTIS
jgi:hypothetical protein